MATVSVAGRERDNAEQEVAEVDEEPDTQGISYKKGLKRVQERGVERGTGEVQ